MNIPFFNSLFVNFKKNFDETNKLLDSISDLEIQIAEKKTRNTNLFNETLNAIKEKESYIKNNTNNKYSTFIKFIDFLNENDIYEINNFEIHNKTGSLIKKQTTESIFIKPDNINFSGDEMFIECFFYKDIYYNELNYEFYDNSGISITPSKIVFVNNKVESNFYEPNFRFFNLNNNNFDNTFYFTAKKLNSVKFYFEKNVNKNNLKVTLRTKNYSTNINDYVTIRVDIPGNLNNYTLFKNTDEYNINLIYSYSFDNLTYVDFKFDEYNKFIVQGGKNKTELFIKIKSDYNNYDTSEKYEKMYNNYKSKNTYKDEVTLKINSNSLISYKVTFTQTQYKKIKELFDKDNVDINNFLEKNEEDIYQVSEKYIKKISNYDFKNLYYYDDISILKDNPEKFNFIFDDKKGLIYTSAFMSEIDYIINTESKNFLVGLDSKLFTPSIFDISIKG